MFRVVGPHCCDSETLPVLFLPPAVEVFKFESGFCVTTPGSSCAITEANHTSGLDSRQHITMPQYLTFTIPKEGVSRDVLEADLPYYLGRDARLVDSEVRASWRSRDLVLKPVSGQIST
jgi:hypothetical protein